MDEELNGEGWEGRDGDHGWRAEQRAEQRAEKRAEKRVEKRAEKRVEGAEKGTGLAQFLDK